MNKILNALVAALLLALVAPAHAQTAKERETKLIAVLQSGASQKEKADACRELGVYGSKDAVPVLAGLLADEKLAHMARYGLETIPDPAVEAALREALGKLTGRLQIGVIRSLAVRRDAESVPALGKLLTGTDRDVAQAAARALGTIGTRDAALMLKVALDGVPAADRLAFSEGLLRAAETLAKGADGKLAADLYAALTADAQAPHQVRTAALRATVLAGDAAAFQNALKSDDRVLFNGAVRATVESKQTGLISALAAALKDLPADRQIVVAQALGVCADAKTLPAVTALTKKADEAVRLAGIRALPMIGQASSAVTLRSLVTDASPEVAKAAADALAGLQGREVEDTVADMLKSSDARERLVATDLIGRRRMLTGLRLLQTAASGSDAKVRANALRRIGELGDASALDPLLDRLARSKESSDLDAVEQALTTLCARNSIGAEKLVGRVAKLEPAQQGVLFRVLSGLGGGAALKAVRAAVDDKQPQVHAEALRALGGWKNAEAAAELLALAKQAPETTDRQLCLNNYLRLASQPEVPTAQRLAMCRDAQPLVQRDEDKKVWLGAVGGIPDVAALALITPLLDNAGTKEEATAAVANVAETLLKGDSAAAVAGRLIEPLTKAAATTANAELAKRANTLKDQAAKKAGK